MLCKKLFAFVFFILTAVLSAAPAIAVSGQEMEFLRMYFTDEELGLVSGKGSPKAVPPAPVNIKVISRKDIEQMGAHTVGDVLNRINGLQGAPHGANTDSPPTTDMHGSDSGQTTVMVDGFMVNDAAAHLPDHVVRMPAGLIERVEVTQGTSSSVRGQSSGVLINIITRAGASHLQNH